MNPPFRRRPRYRSGTCEQAGSFKDAPRCHRVGGSDDNTELYDGMATRGVRWLNGGQPPSRLEVSGLENGGDALAARGADRDQAAYRLTTVLRFGFVQL